MGKKEKIIEPIQDIKIVPKELAMWADVLKGAEHELANTEEIYFKNKEFNTEIIKLAKQKIAELEQQSNR